MEREEDRDFLTTQIITYIGNKRTLIYDIEKEVQSVCAELGKDRLLCADLFSGSGIVSRMLKKYSSYLVVNDLEYYSSILNSCYLTNRSDFKRDRYLEVKNQIETLAEKNKTEGIICKNYAPQDDRFIKKGERVFYTRENALLIDTYRSLIDCCADEDIRKFFLAPLITEASVHVNTSGIFKGFYKDKNTGIGCFGAAGKNALSRILGRITLREPVFSRYESSVEVLRSDAGEAVRFLPELDAVYLDPPYNQHPYGSNYFMLNLILENKIDSPVSRVSGIPCTWNRSKFNRRSTALAALEEIIALLKARYVIISYNSEGFISFDSMKNMLEKYGSVKTRAIEYNTFRGSRNLGKRSLYVNEYLFVLKKEGK